MNEITPADSETFVELLQGLPIRVDDETSAHAMKETLALARVHRLSVYDAAYLELALRRGLPLATLDKKLQGAAEAAGVTAYATR